MRVLGDVPGRAAFPVRGSTEGAGRSRKPNADTLKRVFSLFPSGVVIATVVDRQGEPHGFTASTFVPLSLDPPMILVCLNRSAQCYEAFVTGASFAVSVLRPEHEEIALRFATRGADKFSADHIDRTAGGLPVVRGALATFECRMAGRHPGGDHVILTGVIERADAAETGEAMVHFRRTFRKLIV